MYSRVGASCVGRPTCVCAVWAPLRRVKNIVIVQNTGSSYLALTEVFFPRSLPAPLSSVLECRKEASEAPNLPRRSDEIDALQGRTEAPQGEGLAA